MVEVNCGSLPHSLLESELFGHEKGAFTDARQRKIGLLEEAHGGTVFLDEIGEMDINLQVKLLRVLEDRRIRRLGGSRNIDIDVRIVAATNRDLKAAIAQQKFREDLYYRINVFPIHLPPLRERPQDIPLLLEHFLQHFSHMFHQAPKEISQPALQALMRYPWPGNVRELKNLVERLCIRHEGRVLDVDSLPPELWGQQAPASGHEAVLPEAGLDLEAYIGQIEAHLIAEALERTQGNIAHTARLLALPRGTLRYKIGKYGLQEGG